MKVEFNMPLKECPFCGGTPKINNIGNDHTKKRVGVVECSTSGCSAEIRVGAIIHDMYWCVNKAIEKWNNRVTED